MRRHMPTLTPHAPRPKGLLPSLHGSAHAPCAPRCSVTPVLHTNIHTRTYKHTRMGVRARTHTYSRTHTRTHTRMHTHTHTHAKHLVRKPRLSYPHAHCVPLIGLSAYTPSMFSSHATSSLMLSCCYRLSLTTGSDDAPPYCPKLAPMYAQAEAACTQVERLRLLALSLPPWATQPSSIP